MWNLIDKAKKGRIIVLTTHAMEEADILGDRIGIMARGRLRCLGNGLRLKARFGSGYKMSISIGVATHLCHQVSHRWSSLCDQDRKTKSDKAGEVKSILKQSLGVETFDESEAYLHFLVPNEKEHLLGQLIQSLSVHTVILLPSRFHCFVQDQQETLNIQDIQLSLTPLEEVFLNVARQAELEYARSNAKFEMLTIAEEKNVTIKVFIESLNGRNSSLLRFH